MGIFGTKKDSVKKTEKVEKKSNSLAVVGNKSISSKISKVIVRPRITEKASLMAEQGIYVFEIAKNANKNEVSLAVKAIYGKTPKKVSIVRNPGKEVFRKGKVGRTKEVKKAYVYLQKGDKIEII